MPNDAALWRRRRGAASFALLLMLVAAAHAATTPRPITVAYVASGTIYLDAGRAEGLAVGAVVRIVRGGEKIAELEVDFVAEHSASCKALAVTRAVAKGDTAVVVSLPTKDAAPTPAPAPAPAPEPKTPEPLRTTRTAESARPPTRVYGSLALGYQTLATAGGPSSSENSGRLSLHLRDLAGAPIELRLRARGRGVTRQGYGTAASRHDRYDRLYELAVSWAPPRSRFSLQLGRLSAGPFFAMGTVDGALAQIRLSKRFSLGVFGGTRPDLEELGFASAGLKAGSFVRFAVDRASGNGYAEIVLGGVSERARGGEVSRDYLTLESRFGVGSRWWLSQRAEIDLNRGWREGAAGSTSDVTNAALAFSVRLSESWRASLSYDQRRNFLTWETRPLPEEVFTRYFREGGRVALDWQSRSGWNASLTGGLERADDAADPTTSASFSLLRARAFGWPLLLGGDASFYSGGAAEGWVATTRGRWTFKGGHDLGLTLGASESRLNATSGAATSARANQWARLSGTVQLVGGLYLYGEVEFDTGDDFDGHRATLELGYRF